MKQTVNSLVIKLKESSSGAILGGFGSIKGGMNLMIAENPYNCTNSKVCTGTNSGICTNSGTCTDVTNSVAANCTNSGTCLVS